MIETPLEVQSYKPSAACLSRWVMVLPPENDQEIKEDSALAAAQRQLGPAIAKWSGAEKSFNRMTEFGGWVQAAGSSQKEDPPTILVTLSHHNSDQLYFFQDDSERDNPLSEADINRKFAQPSVAILDGCGTGAEGAVQLIRALNNHGFTTIIATSTEIDGFMAGAFLSVFSEEISKPIPIGLAYWKTIQKLSKIEPDVTTPGPFGANALKFVLLGNSNVSLCLPSQQEPGSTQ